MDKKVYAGKNNVGLTCNRIGLVIICLLLLIFQQPKNLNAQELQWAKSAGGAADDFSLRVVLDRHGNSYIVGGFMNSAVFGRGGSRETTLTSAGSYDVFIAKHNRQGELLWVVSAGGTGIDIGGRIIISQTDEIYISGQIANSAIFGSGEANETILRAVGQADIFIAKYGASGELIWAKMAGGTNYDVGYGIELDLLGNILLTGYYNGFSTFGTGELNETTLNSAGGYDIFIAKYTPNGELLWAKSAGGTDLDLSYGLVVDDLGNSYICGDFGGYYGGTAVFGRGEINETRLYNFGGGDAYGYRDIFLAKYNSEGKLLWARRAGGPSREIGQEVALDRAGNIYMCGIFMRSAIFGYGQANQTKLYSSGLDDIFLAKYNENGELLWARRDGGNNFDSVLDLFVDSWGRLYAPGGFEGTSIFGLGGINQTVLTSAGSSDIFLAQYSQDGDFISANCNGGTGTDRGWSVAVSILGDIYTTGDFANTAVFGAGEPNEIVLTAIGGREIFLACQGVNLNGKIDLIIEQITNLQYEGILNSGQANALITILNLAFEKLESGDTQVATSQIQAFIKQVSAFIKSGKLAEEEGRLLIDAVNELLLNIESGLAKNNYEYNESEKLSSGQFTLSQNYPNPFNALTAINYQVPDPQRIRLEVYDLRGQKVATLTDHYHDAGHYSVNFDTAQLPSSVYIYKIIARDYIYSRKMVLIR